MLLSHVVIDDTWSIRSPEEIAAFNCLLKHSNQGFSMFSSVCRDHANLWDREKYLLDGLYIIKALICNPFPRKWLSQITSMDWFISVRLPSTTSLYQVRCGLLIALSSICYTCATRACNATCPLRGKPWLWSTIVFMGHFLLILPMSERASKIVISYLMCSTVCNSWSLPSFHMCIV